MRARGRGMFENGGVEEGPAAASGLRKEGVGLSPRVFVGDVVLGDSPLERVLEPETCRLDICDGRLERLSLFRSSMGASGLASTMSRALSLS